MTFDECVVHTVYIISLPKKFYEFYDALVTIENLQIAYRQIH